MDNDDRQIGRILSRREVLALFGAAGATLLVGCGAAETGASAPASVAGASAAPASAAGASAAESAAASPSLNAEARSAEALASDPAASAAQEAEVATAEAAGSAVATPDCVVRPEVTEGPYYVDVDLLRSDVREDREGRPFVLTFNVLQVADSGCTPLEGATVEIWHCDAAGSYSGVSDPGFDTEGQTYLRGAQTTDANGVATFTTIYPGWYSGRAVHIHFKVLPTAELEFTSQLFFDDVLSDTVFTTAPYADKGERNTFNSNDNIYQETLLMTVAEDGDGYAATFPIGIDLSTVGTGELQDGGGPGGPGGPPPSGPGGPGGPPPGASASAGAAP